MGGRGSGSYRFRKIAAAKQLNAKTAYEKFGYLVFAAIIIMFAFHMIIPGSIENRKAPVAQLKRFKDKINDQRTLVSYKNLISSVCWTFKRDDVYLYHKAGELTYGLNREDSKHRLLKEADFLKMIKNPVNDIMIIMNSDKRRKALPDFESGYWENEVFVKEYNKK